LASDKETVALLGVVTPDMKSSLGMDRLMCFLIESEIDTLAERENERLYGESL